jgi:flavodoxin
MVDVGIFVGTVYGNAQHVAEQAQQMIESKGYSAAVYDEPTLDQFDKTKTVVFISSTTGQGDLPPNIEFFLMDLRDTCPMMNQKPFAVVGMGDSSYGDTYCGAGRQIFDVLTELQGKPVAEMLEVDAIETLEPETEVVPWLEKQIPALLG